MLRRSGRHRSYRLQSAAVFHEVLEEPVPRLVVAVGLRQQLALPGTALDHTAALDPLEELELTSDRLERALLSAISPSNARFDSRTPVSMSRTTRSSPAPISAASDVFLIGELIVSQIDFGSVRPLSRSGSLSTIRCLNGAQNDRYASASADSPPAATRWHFDHWGPNDDISSSHVPAGHLVLIGR